jgi:signal transduction histidine kinase
MLNYGLAPAFREFADNLMQRSKDTVNVVLDLQPGETRYPQNIEHHVFRIVQEACENSLRHARCKKIFFSGQLTPEEIDLRIHDDGVGFEVKGGVELDTLLANKHFGLVGMVERAKLIGAEVKITTAPGNGTQIRINWHPLQN